MKTFSALLAVIMSLSAHTLVGVHAISCVACPRNIFRGGGAFISGCTDNKGIAACQRVSFAPIVSVPLQCAYSLKYCLSI
ncbi:hypothetical protein BDN67DRAFT_967035 [Paxillus ammoniavirescens]|nr:hypothetical protein BDN67DRAFT_967035 [Paxillus ammoniavirescens]